MARKKKDATAVEEIIHAPVQPQPITETLEKNYMPYVMSVIVSRAIPEIDGLKPAHRKLLYTMYKMGLLTGSTTKSTNVVGQTMRLNPHGEASIYDTLVRLTRAHEALLHPLIESKGSFGKHYSSDMKCAASRYTECKLSPICADLFDGIDKNAVDMVDNYDATMLEPTFLPTGFPNILVMPNMGIAVGMASNICSFNLAEVCDGTIALLKHPNISTDQMMDIIKAPDFPCGGIIVYDREQMKQVYETGTGSIRIRSKYVFDKENSCIDIVEIPYSTSIELIMKRITELVKSGKLKEIVDFRDEIDLSGFKLTLDIRKNTDPDKLMNKLYKMTPLEDSFKCNFNVLINSVPRQLGVVEILSEWIAFRIVCVRRELTFDLGKKRDKLHLLLGLGKILLDIDKAIRIIRRTEKEEDVIPNLEKGFDIDEIQANFIADIKLRNLNRQYILDRISEIEGLQKEIADIEELLADELKLKNYIAEQLKTIKKKYGKPRLSQIIGADQIPEYDESEDKPESTPVKILMSRQGYFKKMTMRSLQGNDVQSFKEGDEQAYIYDAMSDDNIMFITNQCQVYKANLSAFDNTKASALGDFLPAKLQMDPDERPMFMCIQNDYPENQYFNFLFENGKAVRVSASAYETKGTRRKLTGAYSAASPLVAVFRDTEKQPAELMIISDANRASIVKSTLFPIASSRSSGGKSVITLKKGQKIVRVLDDFSMYETKGLRRTKVPAAGTPFADKIQNQ